MSHSVVEDLVTQYRNGALSRRDFLRAGVALGGIALLPSLLAACAPAATSPEVAGTPATVAGGTVVVGLPSDPGAMEASLNLGADTIRWLFFLYDQLIENDLTIEAPKPLALVPGLATSWTVSPDRLEYTFKLRPGVTFHDGSPFDASAVKFNIDRLTQKDHPFYYQRGAGVSSALFGRVAATDVVDTLTARVRIKAPYGDFEDHLATSLGSMQSPQNIQKYGNDGQADHPSGTGPFKFVQKEAGTKLVLAKNPSYWGGAPKIDQVIVRPIREPSAMLSALEAGEIQIAVGLTPDLVDRVKSNPNLDIRVADKSGTECIMLNLQDKPLDDVRVRRALNYAIDRETFTRDILKGLAAPAKGVFSPSSPAYNPKLAGYSYDPERAKALLREAGVDKGFSFNVVTIAASNRGAMAEYIKNALAKIGVTMNIQILDSVAFSAAANKDGTKPGIGGYLLGPTTDPMFNVSRFVNSAFGPPNGGNWNFYKNPEVDRLIAQVAAASSRDERIAIYQKIEGLIVDDAPWLFILHAFEARAYNKKLTWTSSNSFNFTLKNAAFNK